MASLGADEIASAREGHEETYMAKEGNVRGNGVYQGEERVRFGRQHIKKEEVTMKRKAAVVIGVILVILVAWSVTYAAEPIKLKYSQYFPATHKNSVLTGQFCEEIKKRTNGRVEITHYVGGTLTTAPKMFQGVVTGISDFGWASINYNQGRFPVTDSLDLPLGRPNGWVAAQVADDFYRKFTPKEWDSVHVLFLTATGPNIIYTDEDAGEDPGRSERLENQGHW